MPLRIYQCPVCGSEKETLKSRVPTCHVDMVEVLSAPNQKFMVSSDPEHGKSKLKDQEKILKARARNHSRDTLIDENIQINRLNGLDAQVSTNLLNTKGERRKKIDDL